MTDAPEFAQTLREGDRYHPMQDPSALMRAFFPETPCELALGLSNVVALFYGLMLQVVGDRFGGQEMAAISREFFYRLGRAKARATRTQPSAPQTFHGDVRDLVTTLIACVFNASPEYQFSVERYGPEYCVLELRGIDRYYRAAESLGLTQQLDWPPLPSFFEGIRDELGIRCHVQAELLGVDSSACLHARYSFCAG
jgi:hypothetical protein